MPFLTCGYPDEKRFLEYVDAFVDSGADVIEIGFPHSDPLADGPVIQEASAQAIEKGFTLKNGFTLLKQLTTRHTTPFVIMCYSNLIHRHGYGKFVHQAAAAGASGLIVPDMIVEESAELCKLAEKQGLAFIDLITPTTKADRVTRIAKDSQGFIYLVSVAGTTGMRTRVAHNLATTVSTIRKATKTPVCVGFGVSSPAMAKKMSRNVDGVIIGSALIKLIDSSSAGKGTQQVSTFLRQVRRELGERR